MYTRDMVTEHAELFGGAGGHLLSRDSELSQLRRFVADLRNVQEGTN